MDYSIGQLSSILRVDPGEDIIESLIEVGGMIGPTRTVSIVSGVGMLSDLELGFYELDSEEYVHSSFPEILDLSVVSGNISPRDRHPFVHAHVVCNRPDHSTISGHLLRGVVHITAELFLTDTGLDTSRRLFDDCPVARMTF